MNAAASYGLVLHNYFYERVPTGLERVNGSYLAFSSSSSVKICQIEHYRGQRSTGTSVIEANEFKYEVRSDLGFKKPDTAD